MLLKDSEVLIQRNTPKGIFTVLFLKRLHIFIQIRIGPHEDKNRIQWTKNTITWWRVPSCAQQKWMFFIRRVPRTWCHNLVVLGWTVSNCFGGKKWWHFGHVKYFSLITKISKLYKSKDLPVLTWHYFWENVHWIYVKRVLETNCFYSFYFWELM